MKKTLVLGASPNPARVSHIAVQRLIKAGHEVLPFGIREGTVSGIDIQQNLPINADIHTVTLYVRPDLQEAYYDYLLELKPDRIIFNPGTENFELIRLAKAVGIEVEIACTLTMLAVGVY